ncbi:MAG: pyrroloquinoline quinone biosynthesis protein PqqB [Gammaproteobacteria bacterium]|jgi:pyrroloquinoline quinone biosynthesis protein B|nr:pyrroloquinoline quinone biosynthesis protein PqqB [Gammaproteobacteria bacterium]MBT5223443.1 pyrroloquinoline quinone biosynthesis protein PqqB [Gammaproteobacteria bacterium]MBT5826874.1 pyrroloquinoline quinone biosynthesis protein PqqB [Gammaproteobacteria bacterium]MBT5967481.1 pyrroloquinoline quinone biosynthesis protein PqqB [Gammaproteobacteria bacterium]MBT6420447.1 pyrroloquinoline quinone biosynthesis protein PqqB [Gammaproteobacteria bacterium]
MKIRVLGSGAGGGFPQWNCSCPNCKAVRAGSIKASKRNQSSIAISSDGEHWVLFNASPDVRNQLENFPAIHPKNKIRGTGIEAIVMIDSQIDHATGLLILREGDPLTIYCTDMVKQDLSTGFPIFNILQHFCGVIDHPIPLNGDSFTIPNIDDLEFTALALKSKAPPYSPHRNDPHEGDNIGMVIRQISTGKTTFYAPGLGAIEAHVEKAMAEADCVLVDGTFWTDNELASVGRPLLARKIGHLPQSGEGGMIEFLDTLEKPRKILIHINNTNPILNEESEERDILSQHDIEVSFDNMNIEL